MFYISLKQVVDGFNRKDDLITVRIFHQYSGYVLTTVRQLVGRSPDEEELVRKVF